MLYYQPNKTTGLSLASSCGTACGHITGVGGVCASSHNNQPHSLQLCPLINTVIVLTAAILVIKVMGGAKRGKMTLTVHATAASKTSPLLEVQHRLLMSSEMQLRQIIFIGSHRCRDFPLIVFSFLLVLLLSVLCSVCRLSALACRPSSHYDIFSLLSFLLFSFFSSC